MLTRATFTICVLPWICVAANLQAAPASSPGDASLAPASQSSWNLDYAETECRLSQKFGQADQPVTFRITRGAPLRGFQYVIAGKTLRKSSWDNSVKLKIEPNGSEENMFGLWYELPTGENAFWFFGDDAPSLDSMSGNHHIVISFRDAPPLRLQAGKLQDRLSALKICHDDLLSSWKIDASAVRALKVLVSPIGFASWKLMNSIPDRLAARTTKDAIIRLDVSETGRVTRCEAVVSSKSKELDAAVCAAATKRAKFKPAVSETGKPVAAPFVMRLVQPAP